MLKFILFKVNFFKIFQNNLFIDFFIKYTFELLLKNTFIYSAIFFGEKFIIEYWTKKIIESYIFYFNQQTNFFIFKNSFFFIFNLSLIFLFLSLINIIVIII